jgi:hypothetical protein
MNAGQPDANRVAAAVRRVLPSVRADLERLVRIPSVSADPAAAPHLAASAREVAALLRAAARRLDQRCAGCWRRCMTNGVTWRCPAWPAAAPIRST